MPNKSISLEESVRRFWLRVVKGVENECWGWTGVVDKNGYGKFRLAGARGPESASRISYKLNVGTIPKGICVCHSCDNPPCTNPDHLFLGTNWDNQHDMIRKGRARYLVGSDSSMAKLTEEQVREIRNRYQPWKHKTGNNQIALAREFGVNQAQISRILHNSAWQHA